jgi:hypothetical protein
VIHGGIETDAQSGIFRIQDGIVAAGIGAETDGFKVYKIFARSKQYNPDGPNKYGPNKYGPKRADTGGPEQRYPVIRE